MYRVIIAFLLTLIPFFPLGAQNVIFSEDFEQSPFFFSPKWSGDTLAYEIAGSTGDFSLRNNSATDSRTFVQTESRIAFGVWEVSTAIDFNPSSSNFPEIILLSVEDDLSSESNGYRITIKDDVFTLQRMDVDSENQETVYSDLVVDTTIIGDPGGDFRLSARRTAQGFWSLFVSRDGGSLNQAPDSSLDMTYTVSNSFGLISNYTSTRNQRITFDDISIAKYPIFVVSAEKVSSTQIQVNFSEPVLESSIQTTDFTLSSVGNPSSASTEANTVNLTFASAIADGDYQLTINTIEDQFGGSLSGPVVLNLSLSSMATFQDVIINEFRADPPSSGVEYIELFNRNSTSVFNLNGWRYRDGSATGVATIIGDDYFLSPGSYVVIAQDTASLSTEFGQGAYLQPSSWPALNNSGDQIRIFRADGTLIDSLEYSSSWGGADIALERVSPNIASTLSGNWGDSQDALGGTPGRANSLGQDSEPPNIISAQVLDSLNFQLLFNEALNAASATDLTNYSLNNGVSLSSLNFSAPDTVTGTLVDPFPESLTITLTVSGVEDIFGNAISSTSRSLIYLRISEPDSGDVLITEFMYDPPSGGVDYVELFNRSNKNFDLSQFNISDDRDEPKAFPSTPSVFPANSYLVVIGDSTFQDTYPDVDFFSRISSFPTFNNTGDDAIVIKWNDLLLDSLTYISSEWGGQDIALERRNLNVSSSISQNWGPSPHPSLGTPGRENLIGNDTTAPALQGFELPSDSSLSVRFTEPVVLPISSDSIQFTPEIGFTISNIDRSGLGFQFDRKLIDRERLVVEINGVVDLFGNRADALTFSFQYFDIQPADSGDILISEFIHSPAEGLTDAVELHNRSSKSINFRGWTFSDSRSEVLLSSNNLVLPSGNFLVLAPDSTVFPFLTDSTRFVAISSFPSLNNSPPDAIVIRDSAGTIMDSLSYFSSWEGAEASLERLSYEVISSYAENWAPSPASEGHTLGRPNAISPDEVAPELLTSAFLDSVSAVFIFSERIQAAGMDMQVLISDNTVDNVSLKNDSLIVKATNAFADGSFVRFNLPTLFDVFGNEWSAQSVELEYLSTAPVQEGQILLSEFMYDQPPGYSEYIEIFNSGAFAADLRTLQIANSDLAFESLSSLRTLIRANDYLVLAPDSSLFDFFPEANILVMDSGFPSLRNSTDAIVLKNDRGLLQDSLNYFSGWGGTDIALERRSLSVSPIFQSNWGESPNALLGTPGSPNDIPADTLPPVVLAADAIDSVFVQVTFSEALNPGINASTIGVGFSPDEFQLDSLAVEENRLFLSINAPLPNNLLIDLSISGIADVFGNLSPDTTISFGFFSFDSSEVGDLVVNEFLYRDTDEVPEFIELWNISDKVLDLNGWQLGDDGSTITLQAPLAKRPSSGFSIPVPADSFIVLSRDRDFISRTANGFWVRNLPSLNNAGDAIFIRNRSGLLIDSLYYLSSWGGDSPGVSVERRDPFNLSGDPSNWQSNPQGSSPGLGNVVFEPDQIPPSLVFADVINDTTISVSISEFVNLSQISSVFLNGIAIDLPPNVNIADRFEILLDQPIGQPSSQELLVENLRDGRGNLQPESRVSLSWPLRAGGIVINEIMFNPLADADDNQTDQSEYIELFNPNSFHISLQGMFLSDAPDENLEFRDLEIDRTSLRNLAPGSFAVVHSDTAASFPDSRISRFFDIEEGHSFFRVDRTSLSLSNSDDAIFLRDSSGTTIDSVYFDESWHNPNLQDSRGIALERINPTDNSNASFNWGSSTNSLGGTPGRQNTIFQETQTANPEQAILLEPNPFSPDGDGFEDVLTIAYSLDQPDYLLRVRIFDRYGRMIREVVNNFQAGFEGSISWDGFDEYDKAARIGIYIVLVEAYSSASGASRTFKKTVVVARRL